MYYSICICLLGTYFLSMGFFLQYLSWVGNTLLDLCLLWLLFYETWYNVE